MKTKKMYLALVACCLSFLFMSCESELDGGLTGGGPGKVEPLVTHQSNTIQQEAVAKDAEALTTTKAE